MSMLLALLVGCGGNPVVWDAVETGNVFDNVATATLLFGAVEADGRDIAGPHISGGTLTVNARPLKGLQPKGWPVRSLAPDIASVESLRSGSTGVIVELAFHQPGTTDLVLYDENGHVLDVQTLRVRDPEDVELLAWDDLTLQQDEPLDDPLHVVPGTQISLAVSWKDALGNRLLGGGVLDLDDDDAPKDVDVMGRFTGETDVLDLYIDDDADPSTFTLQLGTSEHSFGWEIELHEADDLDEFQLIESPPRGDEPGTLQVVAFADGDRLVGAPISFSWGSGAAQEGTVLLWENRVEGDNGPTKVEACYADFCEAFEVDGVPTGVLGGIAPCGCSSPAGGAPASLVIVLLGLLRRRR